MRIFVTGATGFVGSAVVEELLRSGYQVLGMTRSEKGADALRAAGADVHYGELTDLDSLRAGAAATDGTIHTAFIHDFSKFRENCEIDRKVIGALGDVLAGSGRPLVVTSGTALVASNEPATEDMKASVSSDILPRVASEEAADEAAAKGARVSIMRLSPSVHGDGDHGFVPHLIALAKEKGVSAYVGSGKNRWPGVHRLDAARLYRLAVEKNAANARYHAAAEEGVPLREIATIIGKRLNVPVAGLSDEDAAAHFGWFKHFVSLDAPTSSETTRAQTGWQPREIGLLEDIDHERYFAA